MSLTLRLLTACRQSYWAKADGTVADVVACGPAPASSGIGWLAPPRAVVTGLLGVPTDAAIVGEIPEGLLVVVRGTTPDGMGTPEQFAGDWGQDALAPLTPMPGLPGRVHLGFACAALRLAAKIEPILDALDPQGVKPLFLSGHSKGGAVDPPLAWLLRGPGRKVSVTAFAPARMGDAVFARALANLGIAVTRIEATEDIVPHLPAAPELLKSWGLPVVVPPGLEAVDYAPVGQLVYIRDDGTFTGDSDALQQARVLMLAHRLAEPGGLAYVAGCHSIDEEGAPYVRGAANIPD